MNNYKSKYISIKQKDVNQYEIKIDDGEYTLSESDILIVNNENYHLKSFRIGEVYTKDSGVMDATVDFNEYHFKKSDVEDFQINPLAEKVQLSIRLKDKIIELVNIKNDEKLDENITRLALIIINGKL